VTPARGLVWVRRVETPETTPHGHIVLTPDTRDALTVGQMEVVAIGAPAYCVDPDCERCNRLTGIALYPEAFMHPTSAQVGDWVLVKHRSLTATHEDGLYCCQQDELLAILTA
jgi:hypothetical protein